MYIDERHFVKTAIQKMDFLEEVWTNTGSIDQRTRTDQSGSALDAIKETAATVQARGVYRAAALCEDVMSRLTTDQLAKMNTPLVKLKRLINLYADGLFEIDPEFAVLLHEPDDQPIAEITLSDAHAMAVQTLTPLAHRVESETLRGALKSLMRPVSVGSAQSSDRKTMSLDALIQPISNLVLSEARHCGKNVSVSYAADFADLSFDLGEFVQDILEAACLKIVSHGIPKSMNAEPGVTPQISMTGQSRGGNILFSVSWMGASMDSKEHVGFQTQMDKLEQRGGTYSFNNLNLSDELKSRHTLYITLPMADTAGVGSMMSRSRASVAMSGGRNA